MHLGEYAMSSLIDLLQDPRPDVRHHAAHVLGKIGQDAAVDALITALSDQDHKVVLKAAVALQQIGNLKAIPALMGILGHENREVRTTLMSVLSHFGTEAVPALLETLNHERWQVREQALDILGSLGDPRAVPVIANALDDAHWQVRFAAVHALANINDRASRNILATRQTDPHTRVNNLLQRVNRKPAPTSRQSSSGQIYHRLEFPDVTDCSAFLAGLARFLDSPQSADGGFQSSEIEVWCSRRKSRKTITVYFNHAAFDAINRAFGESPAEVVGEGRTLPDGSVLVLTGDEYAHQGMKQARKHIIKKLVNAKHI